jgi:hypothetical protein
MPSRTVPVIAQWALEGKQPDGEDYRILACSTGDLNRRHFEEGHDQWPGTAAADGPGSIGRHVIRAPKE